MMTRTPTKINKTSEEMLDLSIDRVKDLKVENQNMNGASGISS